MAWQDTSAWLRIKDFHFFYYNRDLYRRYTRSSHINPSLPGKCIPWSQDRLQYSGVEVYFRREEKTQTICTCICFSCPVYFLRPSFLPPSRNSDPGSHNRLFPPLPATLRAWSFYCDKMLAISSLVDSRWIAPFPRYTLWPVDPYNFFLEINSKGHHGAIRTPVLTLFEGWYH